MGSTNLRRTNWDPTWSSTALGLQNKVNPDLKLMLDPITTGTTGKVILGYRIVGLEGKVSIVVRETTLALIRKLAAPWWSSGLVPLVPSAINVDLYSYAALLTLHPHDLGAGTVTEDINLLKTVPVNAYHLERDGVKDDEWMVDFMVFPDRSLLEASPPTLVYGYIGAAA